MREIISNNQLCTFFGGDFELIEEGDFSGEYNMTFDYERTKKMAGNECIPMLRFYGWKPWAVSLGYNQKDSDISEKLCREKGFDIVRRPTGGRAVLHAAELTYSVVMNIGDRSLQELYRGIHAILLKGFHELGCEGLGYEQAQPDFSNFYRNSGMSVSCFASSARYEIEWNGRKVVGSAQRLFGNTLLQHGSIILDRGHEELADVVSLPDDSSREKLRKFIVSHSASLSEACGRTIGYREVVDCILKTIQQG